MSHNKSALIQDQQNDMYFGSEVLNRVSFLREDTEFICKSIKHPSTRFVAFSRTDPLINKSLEEKLLLFTNGDNQNGSSKVGLATLSETWRDAISQWSRNNREEPEDARAPGKPVFVFLGLEDESVGLKLGSLKAQELEEDELVATEKFFDHQGRYQGIAYYAVDVTNAPEIEKVLYENALTTGGSGSSEDIFFTKSRKHYLGFTHKEAALYSHGKMFLDWLERNLFCPGCGSKVIPINGGGKLKCTNLTKVVDQRSSSVGSISSTSSSGTGERVIWECPVKRASVSNVSFPRTDAVIITAITNTDRTKVLLSLSKRHAATRMYACTAGFMEPSETVEVATKREIWEETGVVCDKINIVMTQPWPFPGNLMIGCLGIVDFNGVNEQIHLDHDRELADARWFDTDLIRKWIYEDSTIDNPEEILLPNPESIAFLLIKMAIDQRVQKL